ncbi:hypothetical protein ACJX0J_028831, partial [Zea mays]
MVTNTCYILFLLVNWELKSPFIQNFKYKGILHPWQQHNHVIYIIFLVYNMLLLLCIIYIPVIQLYDWVFNCIVENFITDFFKKIALDNCITESVQHNCITNNFITSLLFQDKQSTRIELINGFSLKTSVELMVTIKLGAKWGLRICAWRQPLQPLIYFDAVYIYINILKRLEKQVKNMF